MTTAFTYKNAFIGSMARTKARGGATNRWCSSSSFSLHMRTTESQQRSSLADRYPAQQQQQQQEEHRSSSTTTTSTTNRTPVSPLHSPTSSSNTSSRRRQFFHQAFASLAALTVAPSRPAHAGGLLQFPIGPKTQPLKNRYHFMRAAPSELEVQGIYSTNPLFLTNRENAMHVETGEALVLQALEHIRTGTPDDLFPTIAYHSLAANGMDTADLVARTLQLGREKLLPEFTYLDQRGIGLWDAGDEALIRPAIWALDKEEAGREGKGGRPPAHVDGTPNETLGDQFIRLRQFLSLQESRTAGDVILVIFPDGTGPALMSCMIAGIPFSEVHALEFAPGEVRLDISPESVQKLYAERKDDPAYLATIEDGKEKLALLRNPQTKYVGLKEERAEQERIEIEELYLQQKQTEARNQQARQQKLALDKERRLQDQKDARRDEKYRQWQASSTVVVARTSPLVSNKKADSTTSTKSSDDMDFSVLLGGAAAAVGVAGIGMATLGGGSVNKESITGTSSHSSSSSDSIPAVGMNTGGNGGNDEASAPTVASSTSFETMEPSPSSTNKEGQTTTLSPTLQPLRRRTTTPSLFDNDVPIVRSSSAERKADETQEAAASATTTGMEETTIPPSSDNDRMIDQHLIQLAAAEEAMREALLEASQNQPSQTSNKNKNNAAFPDDIVLDGGANDWLQSLMEIRDEPDYEDGDEMEEAEEEEMELVVVNGDRRTVSWDDNNSSPDSNSTLSF